MKNICVIGCGFVGAALSIVICNENNSSYLLGDGPNQMTADRQTFGIVYIGSNGRGIYYSTYIS